MRLPNNLGFGIFIACTIAAIFLVVMAKAARTHSFYPHECCHDKDCAPIKAARVKEVAGGYLVDDRFFVRREDARIPPDGQHHACFPSPDKLQCLFVPPGAV